MIETYKKIGVEIISYTEDSITIDKQTAFTITMTGKLKEQKVVIYGMTIGNSKATILYQGVASSFAARYFGCGTIRMYGFGDFQPCG